MENIDWEVLKPVIIIVFVLIALWTIIYGLKTLMKYFKKVGEITSQRNSRRSSIVSSVFGDDRMEEYRYSGIVNLFNSDNSLRKTRLSPIPSLDRPSVTSKYYSGRNSGKIDEIV